METVAVIAKFDCRVLCHINSLGEKISNTAATIQPNPLVLGKLININSYSASFSPALTDPVIQNF